MGCGSPLRGARYPNRAGPRKDCLPLSSQMRNLHTHHKDAECKSVSTLSTGCYLIIVVFTLLSMLAAPPQTNKAGRHKLHYDAIRGPHPNLLPGIWYFINLIMVIQSVVHTSAVHCSLGAPHPRVSCEVLLTSYIYEAPPTNYSKYFRSMPGLLANWSLSLVGEPHPLLAPPPPLGALPLGRTCGLLLLPVLS